MAKLLYFNFLHSLLFIKCSSENCHLIPINPSEIDVFKLQSAHHFNHNQTQTKLKQICRNQSKNTLRVISKNVFTLDYQKNWLSKIKLDIKSDFTYILSMNLSNNNIISLEHAPFKVFSSLEILDLSDNDITILNENSFAGPKNLRNLYLNQNRIVYLSVTFFRTVLNSLQVLSVSNNPLICENGLLEGIRDIEAHINYPISVCENGLDENHLTPSINIPESPVLIQLGQTLDVICSSNYVPEFGSKISFKGMRSRIKLYGGMIHVEARIDKPGRYVCLLQHKNEFVKNSTLFFDVLMTYGLRDEMYSRTKTLISPKSSNLSNLQNPEFQISKNHEHNNFIIAASCSFVLHVFLIHIYMVLSILPNFQDFYRKFSMISNSSTTLLYFTIPTHTSLIMKSNSNLLSFYTASKISDPQNSNSSNKITPIHEFLKLFVVIVFPPLIYQSVKTTLSLPDICDVFVLSVQMFTMFFFLIITPVTIQKQAVEIQNKATKARKSEKLANSHKTYKYTPQLTKMTSKWPTTNQNDPINSSFEFYCTAVLSTLQLSVLLFHNYFSTNFESSYGGLTVFLLVEFLNLCWNVLARENHSENEMFWWNNSEQDDFEGIFDTEVVEARISKELT